MGSYHMGETYRIHLQQHFERIHLRKTLVPPKLVYVQGWHAPSSSSSEDRAVARQLFVQAPFEGTCSALGVPRHLQREDQDEEGIFSLS